MNFRKTSKEERAEWHGQPMTKAAFALLGEHIEDARRGLQSSALGSDEREVRVAAGKLRGLELALQLLSEE